MLYIIFIIILAAASYFIGNLGCMGIYRAVGVALFIVGIFYILNDLNIHPFNLLGKWISS